MRSSRKTWVLHLAVPRTHLRPCVSPLSSSLFVKIKVSGLNPHLLPPTLQSHCHSLSLSHFFLEPMPGCYYPVHPSHILPESQTRPCHPEKPFNGSFWASGQVGGEGCVFQALDSASSLSWHRGPSSSTALPTHGSLCLRLDSCLLGPPHPYYST